MKPFGQEKRPKDWIPFVNFAMVENVPRKLSLRENLFPYVGAKGDDSLIWGVYGTTSINAAIFAAASHAVTRRCQSLQITSWYFIENFKSVTTQITRESSMTNGYLHLGRLNAAFRNEIRDIWLGWIARDMSKQSVGLENESLEDLAIRFPMLVRRMLADVPEWKMIIHPVQQEYTTSTVPIWIATAKVEKDRIKTSEVRFIPDIEIVI